MPRYREHLLRLDAEDRHMRFGCSIDDAGIEAHLQGLRERTDRILALLDEFGSVVAAVHIARLEAAAAELAMSVDRCWRQRGLGRALFEHALSWLRCRGIRRVYLVFFSANGAMRTLARSSGMNFQNEGGQVTAEMTLPLPTPFSMLLGLAAEYMAQWPVTLRRSAGAPVPAFQPA